MRREAEIRQRLKQLLFRHRKKLIERGFKIKPSTCVHNQEMAIEGIPVGVCVFKGESGPTGRLCDARAGGLILARDCSFWTPIKTADVIKQEFQDFIETSQRGEVALEYPDVMALMWVLGEDDDPLFPLEDPPSETVLDVQETSDA